MTRAWTRTCSTFWVRRGQCSMSTGTCRLCDVCSEGKFTVQCHTMEIQFTWSLVIPAKTCLLWQFVFIMSMCTFPFGSLLVYLMSVPFLRPQRLISEAVHLCSVWEGACERRQTCVAELLGEARFTAWGLPTSMSKSLIPEQSELSRLYHKKITQNEREKVRG